MTRVKKNVSLHPDSRFQILFQKNTKFSAKKSVGFLRINFENDLFDISSIDCAPEFTNENAWVDPKDLKDQPTHFYESSEFLRSVCSILLMSFEEGHILDQQHQSNV